MPATFNIGASIDSCGFARSAIVRSAMSFRCPGRRRSRRLRRKIASGRLGERSVDLRIANGEVGADRAGAAVFEFHLRLDMLDAAVAVERVDQHSVLFGDEA